MRSYMVYVLTVVDKHKNNFVDMSQLGAGLVSLVDYESIAGFAAGLN